MSLKVEICSDGGRTVVKEDAQWEVVASGVFWAEGPVYVPFLDSLLFSDVVGNTMYKWNVTKGLETFRTPSHYSNGNCLDCTGQLLTCEHQMRRVTQTDFKTTKVDVIADQHDGKPLNSPNDIVCKSDGSIFFSDPEYGCQISEGHGNMPEQAGNYVYCVRPNGLPIIPVVTDMLRPNGLCFSPDESLLYVADSGATRFPKYDQPCQVEYNWDDPHHIRVYDVVNGYEAKNGRVFKEIENGAPDGIRTDVQGNLYVATFKGVEVFTSDATPLCIINTPKRSANCTFGGQDNTTLFITATDTVWSIQCNIKGSV